MPINQVLAMNNSIKFLNKKESREKKIKYFKSEVRIHFPMIRSLM